MQPANIRLRLGLRRSLICFAPLAFVSQCQFPSRDSPTPLVFPRVSTHFTTPPSVPIPLTAGLHPLPQKFTLLWSFILHAASRGHACAHCRLFLIAASRRSGGRVSVPLWLTTLMRPATCHWLRRPLPHQPPDRPQGLHLANSYVLSRHHSAPGYGVLPHLSMSYSPPRGRFLRVTQPSAALLTLRMRSPKVA